MRRAIVFLAVCAASRAQLTIEGNVVRKSTGEPVPGVRVSDVTVTDANGHFLLPALPSAKAGAKAKLLFDGANLLPRVQMVTGGAQGTHVTVLVKMTPQAVIAGKVVDENGWPIRAVVTVAQYRTDSGVRELDALRRTQTDDGGEYRLGKLPPGRYYVRVRPVGVAPWSDYLPVWYPSASDFAGARAIDLGEGQRISADVHLSPGGGAEVRGRVTLPNGISQGYLSIAYDEMGATNVPGLSVPIAPDGTFLIRHVAPGKYWLQASTTNLVDNSMPKYLALQAIEVSHDNIDGIALNVAPTVVHELKGTIVSEGGIKPDQVNIALQRRSSNQRLPAKVNPDGTFVISGVWPGEYFANAGAATGLVTSFRFGDRGVLSGPFEFDGTEAPLRVTVGEMGTVSGTVTDAKGRPVGGAAVIFVPSLPRWGPAMTDQNGGFTFPLPAGTHRLYVVEDPAEVDRAMSDSDFRKSQEAAIPPVTVHAGENAPLKLQLPPR